MGRLAAALPEMAASERRDAPGHREAVLTLLGEFLPLDEERAVDACVWMAFKNAARIRPFLAAEADRSHREVAAVVGQVITALVPDDGDGQQSWWSRRSGCWPRWTGCACTPCCSPSG